MGATASEEVRRCDTRAPGCSDLRSSREIAAEYIAVPLVHARRDEEEDEEDEEGGRPVDPHASTAVVGGGRQEHNLRPQEVRRPLEQRAPSHIEPGAVGIRVGGAAPEAAMVRTTMPSARPAGGTLARAPSSHAGSGGNSLLRQTLREQGATDSTYALGKVLRKQGVTGNITGLGKALREQGIGSNTRPLRQTLRAQGAAGSNGLALMQQGIRGGEARPTARKL